MTAGDCLRTINYHRSTYPLKGLRKSYFPAIGNRFAQVFVEWITYKSRNNQILIGSQQLSLRNRVKQFGLCIVL